MATHYILAPTCAQPFSVMPAHPPALIPPSIHANKALEDAREYTWFQNHVTVGSYAHDLLLERLNRTPSWVDAFTNPRRGGKNSWTSRMPGARPPLDGEEMWELLHEAHQRLRVQDWHDNGA